MDPISNFRSIDELVKALDRERVLFRDMFERRKSMAYRSDFAMEIVDYKKERIRFLIEHGVIHENGDFLELEDVYVRFFEEVLDMNEEIGVASVKEYMESLLENINYYLEETNEHRKHAYHGNVRKILRKIGLRTLKNVVDLKRNVDVAYKQEPNYRIKKTRLINLDEKRKNIKLLMKECERIMDEQIVFFRLGSDPDLDRTCMDVRNDFTEADHSLLEIERQIIEYINKIEQQGRLFKKIRRLKYLKDQMIWVEDTDVRSVLARINPLWMEKRPYNKVFISIDALGRNEDAYTIIRKIKGLSCSRRKGRTEAEPIDTTLLSEKPQELPVVDTAEIWNSFKAQGRDLFNFIKDYNYRHPRSLDEHVVLFCQMASVHSEELLFTENFATAEHIEYALIYAQ